jgi:hypothetical protein
MLREEIKGGWRNFTVRTLHRISLGEEIEEE